jgi:3-carboxy-cis,cis-muconate cycloisomerase
MPSRLIDSLATTEPLAAAFSDAAVLRAMLDFEVQLAATQARLGLIPATAADAIARAADVEAFDAGAIAREARVSATPSIAFVSALTARVLAIDAASARFVHFGATSQDVADTALILCLQRVWPLLIADHVSLLRTLIDLSDEHATTVMLGRTLLQPATPITFGLKVAGWAGELTRAWSDVASAFEQARLLQFGGAAGTLASLASHGPSVQAALAASLGLACPDAPWHVHRDRLARLLAALGIYTGALGKMATDVALLMQDEIAEVFERGGGSSTMPQKRNPASCAIVLAAAIRVPGLVSAFFSSMVQQHERAVGGWHAEAPIISATVQTCGSALAAAVDVVSGLTVSRERMRANLAATGGVIYAERVTLLLAAKIDRMTATRLVTDAVTTVRSSGRSFRNVVASTPAIARWLTAGELADIDSPEEYLGSAEIFRARLVAAARASLALTR